MRSFDFQTGVQDLVLQFLLNCLFILPAAFLCFYAIGKENMKRSWGQVAGAALISVVIYTGLYYPLWYFYSVSDGLFMLLYIVVSFLYLTYVGKPEGFKLFFVFHSAIFIATFANTLFNLLRRLLLPVEPNDLWRWSELLIMVLLAAVITPPAARFMRGKVWPAVAGLRRDGWKHLWILSMALIIMMLVTTNFMVEAEQAIGWQAVVIIMLLSMVAFVSLMQMLYMIETQQENARQKDILRRVDEQASRYAELATYTQNLKVMQHDLHHHLNALDGMLQEKRYAEAENYLQKYGANIELCELPLCDCYVVDVIARRYKVQAEQEGIRTDFRLALPEDPGVEGLDLCVVLGNLLENALNACAAQKKSEKFIRTLVKSEGPEILIAVDNSYDADSEKEGGTALGIPSVRTIANKYKGVAKFEKAANVFSASVLLYKPDK